MDVDRVAVDRPLVGKYLHAIDQRDDAVGLVGDQPRQRAVLVGSRQFEQLRSAANAGERVLDLMREHRGKAGDRARRAAMRHLPVDLVGHRPFLEHHHDEARKFRHRRNVEIDDLLDAEARRRHVDAVLVDRRTALAHLIDQRQQRTAEGNEAGQRVAGEHGRARAEKVLGIGIGEGDEPFRIDHDHRAADRVEHDMRGVRHFRALSDSWPSCCAPQVQPLAQYRENTSRSAAVTERARTRSGSPCAALRECAKRDDRDTSRGACVPGAGRFRCRRAPACPRSGRRRSRPGLPGFRHASCCIPAAAAAIAPAVHGAP